MILRINERWSVRPPHATPQRTFGLNRADKMAMLYDHLCSVEFRQHIEAIVESFLGLKEQLDGERRAFAC